MNGRPTSNHYLELWYAYILVVGGTAVFLATHSINIRHFVNCILLWLGGAQEFTIYVSTKIKTFKPSDFSI